MATYLEQWKAAKKAFETNTKGKKKPATTNFFGIRQGTGIEAALTKVDTAAKAEASGPADPTFTTANQGFIKVKDVYIKEVLKPVEANTTGVYDGKYKTECLALETALTTIATAIKDERIRRIGAYTVKHTSIPLIRKNAMDVKTKGYTVDNYVGGATSGFHQSVRGLNAALAKSGNPALIKFQKEHFNKYAQDDFKPTADGQVSAKVGQVLATLMELEKLVQ